MAFLNEHYKKILFIQYIVITLLLIFLFGCNNETREAVKSKEDPRKESKNVAYHTLVPRHPVTFKDVSSSIELTHESLRFWNEGNYQEALERLSKAADLVAVSCRETLVGILRHRKSLPL